MTICHNLDLLLTNQDKHFLAKLQEIHPDSLALRISSPFNTGFIHCDDINAWFILNGLRYSFDAEVIITSEEKNDTLLVVQKPKLIKFRETRKFIRLENPIENQSEAHIKDISMSGLALAIPKSQKKYNIKDIVTLNLELPYEVGESHFYRKTKFKVQVVRIEDHKDHILYGMEYFELKTFEQSMLYQYILSRKNELVFKESPEASIKLIGIV